MMLTKTSKDTKQLSDADFEQYDRQIRLWGVDAQRRLKNAHVLVIGLGGFGSEVAKNVVLSGVGNVTMMDHEVLTSSDLNSQLLVRPEDVGVNRAMASFEKAQALNPNVVVRATTINIHNSLDVVKNFDVVFLSSVGHRAKVSVNTACRKHGVKFLCGSDHGFYASGFMDLGIHHYQLQQEKKKEDKSNGNKERIPKKEEESDIHYIPEDGEEEDVPAEMEAEVEIAEEHSSDDDIVEVMIKSNDDKAENNVDEGGNGDNGSPFMAENYCSYDTAISGYDWTKRTKKEMRQSSAAFFVMRVVERFYDNHNKYPRHNRDDYLNLRKYKFEIMKECKINNGCLAEDFYLHCIGSLSPVVAIAAGVMTQVILKAITRQGKPHRNFFFFDGQRKTGIVDYIGPK